MSITGGGALTTSASVSTPAVTGSTSVVTPRLLNGTNAAISIQSGVSYTSTLSDLYGTVIGGNWTNTVASGSFKQFHTVIAPNYNRSGTGEVADLTIARYEQAISSGAQYLIQAGTSSSGSANNALGGTFTRMFSVNNLGTVSSNGNIVAYVAKSGTYTATGADHTIEATTGTFTITLPTAVGRAGQVYFITNSGSGVLTLGTTSSQTFVNVTATPTTLTLAQFVSYIVVSNGANWLAK
jgi:hypothetical protein